MTLTEQRIKKALTNAAVNDLNIAARCGCMAIADTKIGVVHVSHENGVFSLATGDGEGVFQGNREETKVYLIENVYQVVVV